jgi:hypothetical protein
MIRRETHASYLTESLTELEAALGHLSYSAATCDAISSSQQTLTEDDLIKVEAFTSRFARVIDIMSKRVLRAIDQYEMLDPGTLLDVANRAEKRGLIDSTDWLRDIKDARNQIAHDYSGERLSEIFTYCRSEIPKLIDTCSRITKYGTSLLNK